MEVGGWVSRRGPAEQPTPSATVHAPSLNSVSLPLCGAKEFRCVTMDFQTVTCETCTALLNGRLDDATQISYSGEDR